MGTFGNVAPIASGSFEANENLRGWLRQQGDDGSEPRPVLHYAYPLRGAVPQSRTQIVSEMEARGFEVGAATLRNGLIFQHETSVTSGRFDELTKGIAALLAFHGWEYDSWECGPMAAGTSLADWRQLEGFLLH